MIWCSVVWMLSLCPFFFPARKNIRAGWAGLLGWAERDKHQGMLHQHSGFLDSQKVDDRHHRDGIA